MSRCFRLRFSPGFTLADMLVATTIVVTLSVVLVVNFRAGSKRDELRSGALLLASLLHQAQTYTLSGYTVDYGGEQTFPDGGYGISFDTQSDTVYFFGSDGSDNFFSPGGEIWEEPYSLAEYNIELDDRICIDVGSGCTYNDLKVDFIFTPPLGSRILQEVYLNQGLFKVVVRHHSLPGKGMFISGNAGSGQVNLGPLTDIPTLW